MEMKRIIAFYRGKSIKSNTGRYFDGIVHNCCKVSAANNDLAFAIHRVGVFGGPVIEQIARPDDVKLSESDDCVIVKDGFVYHLTKEAI